MPASKNTQSGFSLIELLVAVVILAVGLLGLAQLQVTAIRANSQNASSTAATAIAQQALEAVIAWGHNDTRLTTSQTGKTFALADDGLGPTVTVAGAGTFNVTWDVTTPYAGAANLSRIDVNVQSASDVMGVLGNKVKTVTAHTVMRTY